MARIPLPARPLPEAIRLPGTQGYLGQGRARRNRDDRADDDVLRARKVDSAARLLRLRDRVRATGEAMILKLTSQDWGWIAYGLLVYGMAGAMILKDWWGRRPARPARRSVSFRWNIVSMQPPAAPAAPVAPVAPKGGQ